MGSVFRVTAHLSFLHHLSHPHLPVTRVQANPASLDSRAAAVATSAAQTRQARGDSPAHGALSRFLTSEAASEIGDRLEEVSGLQDLKGRQVQLNRRLWLHRQLVWHRLPNQLQQVSQYNQYNHSKQFNRSIWARSWDQAVRVHNKVPVLNRDRAHQLSQLNQHPTPQVAAEQLKTPSLQQWPASPALL